MINICQRNDGLIEFELSSYKKLISCTVNYSFDEKEWKPASVYRSIDIDYMLDKSDWRYWNNAILKGIVRFEHDDDDFRIYWNKYINIRNFTGVVFLKFDILTTDGIHKMYLNMTISSGSTVYLNDWSDYAGGNGIIDASNTEQKWLIEKGNSELETLTAQTGQKLVEIEVCPYVEGMYDIFVCLKNDVAAFYISTSRCESRTKFITAGNMSGLYEHNFKDKLYKEIKWKNVLFDKDTKIVLSQIQSDTSIMEFGKIAYLKLVPCTSTYPVFKDNKMPLTIYFEPYSCAALYKMFSRDDVHETLDEFMRLAPSEITCQVCRVGSKTLHNSSFIDKFDIPARCDDKLVHDGPSKLAHNIDVLQVVSEYCKEKDVTLTVCLGVNAPYLWLKEISDGFVQRNIDKIKDSRFDYTYPEVMDYATSIVEELVNNYDIDGISLDFMRNEDNQTRETLIEFVRRVRKILDNKKYDKKDRMRLTVRVPSYSDVYYEAAGVWVKDNLVDIIVPSNAAEMFPIPRIEHYVHLCRNSSTKVFGCIDGWKKSVILDQSFGNAFFTLSPNDIKNFIKHYKGCGVDGMFVYQGENYAFNPLVTQNTFEEE